jgi:hypothetical protein
LGSCFISSVTGGTVLYSKASSCSDSSASISVFTDAECSQPLHPAVSGGPSYSTDSCTPSNLPSGAFSFKISCTPSAFVCSCNQTDPDTDVSYLAFCPVEDCPTPAAPSASPAPAPAKIYYPSQNVITGSVVGSLICTRPCTLLLCCCFL